jgi:hypothetical protein
MTQIRKSPIQVPEIDRSFCSQCGSQMWLSQISSDGSGKEYRILDCPVCDISKKNLHVAAE